MVLKEYLASVAQRRWKIGDLDCSTFMADWIVANGLADPIADVRGTYHTERQYQRILLGHGSFIEACKHRLAAVGMRRAGLDLREGDIAVVTARGAREGGQIKTLSAGAIVVRPDRVAIVTSDLGLFIGSTEQLPIVKAWTF